MTRAAIQPITVHPTKKFSSPMANALLRCRVAAMAQGKKYPKREYREHPGNDHVDGTHPGHDHRCIRERAANGNAHRGRVRR